MALRLLGWSSCIQTRWPHPNLPWGCPCYTHPRAEAGLVGLGTPVLGTGNCTVWKVAVEGWVSSLSWFLDLCESSAGLSVSLPSSRHDLDHVPAFRQHRGFGLSLVNGPRRVPGVHKLHPKEEGLVGTGFYPFIAKRWRRSLFASFPPYPLHSLSILPSQVGTAGLPDPTLPPSTLFQHL